MIAIVFYACIALVPNQPPHCQPVSLSFAEDAAGITPYTCAMYGQVHMAQWSREHPNWTLGRFKGCSRPGKFAKI